MNPPLRGNIQQKSNRSRSSARDQAPRSESVVPFNGLMTTSSVLLQRHTSGQSQIPLHYSWAGVDGVRISVSAYPLTRAVRKSILGITHPLVNDSPQSSPPRMPR
ncbi:hypothetical protein LZ30DRAFT_459429 [Colletotrichum cereale]|nr:hypothetical protein LZ30DRAFT_459429 [Colletotrichum cereale]